jgi:hypothetical protein
MFRNFYLHKDFIFYILVIIIDIMYENLKNISINSKSKIITLCGSTKYKDLFLQINSYLTMNGKIVLMPGVYVHADCLEISETDKINLDILHKEKINMSDTIVVINKDNYIGSSTKSEIDYAINKGKNIIYLEN